MTSMAAEDAGANVRPIKDFLRSTLREVDELRKYLRERLYALQLAEDPTFHDDLALLQERLGAEEAPKTIDADEFRRKYLTTT